MTLIERLVLTELIAYIELNSLYRKLSSPAIDWDFLESSPLSLLVLCSHRYRSVDLRRILT